MAVADAVPGIFLQVVCVLVFSFVFLPSPADAKDVRCLNQTTACSCITNKGLLDLHKLQPRNYDESLHIEETGEIVTIYYHPCFDVKTTYGECSGQLACMKIKKGKKDIRHKMGDRKSAKIETDNTGNLVIVYSAKADGVVRTLKVALRCDDDVSGKFKVLGKVRTADQQTRVSEQSYLATFTSKYAICKSCWLRPSPGSMFLALSTALSFIHFH